MAPVQPYTDHDTLIKLLETVKYKNLPAHYGVEEATAFKKIYESEIGDLIDDLRRFRAIATLQLSFAPPLFPCAKYIGTLYSACDYQLYYIIDNHHDLKYVIYFPEDDPSAVHIIRPLTIEDGAHFYYGQIVNAVHLALFENYYDLLKVFTQRYDHRDKFIEIYLRNKNEKTIKVIDNWYWTFDQWLTSTLSII